MILFALFCLFLYAAFVATSKGWEVLANIIGGVINAVRSYKQGS